MGADAASSQSIYNQKFLGASSKKSDSVFLSALVPLKLFDINDKKVIWENPCPSSPFFCRPILFEFTKETNESVRLLFTETEAKIASMTQTFLENLKITHELYSTMVDGKLCNILCDNSSAQNCFLCGSRPVEMNKFKTVRKKKILDLDFCKNGLCPLHTKIRCFECCLHIAYNQDFKKWSARTGEQKSLKKWRKKKIQTKFEKKLGMRVDFIKRGVGTTNNGNMAWRFFKNPKLSARLTGVDEKLSTDSKFYFK